MNRIQNKTTMVVLIGIFVLAIATLVSANVKNVFNLDPPSKPDNSDDCPIPQDCDIGDTLAKKGGKWVCADVKGVSQKGFVDDITYVFPGKDEYIQTWLTYYKDIGYTDELCDVSYPTGDEWTKEDFEDAIECLDMTAKEHYEEWKVSYERIAYYYDEIGDAEWKNTLEKYYNDIGKEWQSYGPDWTMDDIEGLFEDHEDISTPVEHYLADSNTYEFNGEQYIVVSHFYDEIGEDAYISAAADFYNQEGDYSYECDGDNYPPSGEEWDAGVVEDILECSDDEWEELAAVEHYEKYEDTDYMDTLEEEYLN